MIISYAQNFEDIMLFRALRERSNGVYIDIGAWDPDKDSVTKLFYDNGWSGINIEPSQIFFKKLKSKRKRDTNLNIAIGAECGQAEFIEIPGSGLSSINRDALERARKHGLKANEYKIPVKTLDSIVDKYCPGVEIAFLKIDVEGLEKPIIESVDWSRIRPILIVVEAIHPDSGAPTWIDWESSLIKANYKPVWFDGLNKFYLREESKELQVFFSTPPSLVDGFHLAPGHPFMLPVRARIHLGVKRLLPQKAYQILLSSYHRFFR